MSVKRIAIILIWVVVGIGALVSIFAGVTAGFVFYTIVNSEATATAKTFLKSNERLKQDIGIVKDFGWLVTGSVNVQNSEGRATVNLKVIGEKRTVNASVELIYRKGKAWRVSAASYKNEAGQTVELLDIYDSINLKSQISDLKSIADR